MAYIKIPVTPAMERDYKECVAMEGKGQEKDCSGCSLNGGNQECLANNEWVKDDKAERVLSRIREILSDCEEVSDEQCQETICSDCKLERIEQAIKEGLQED